MPQSKSSVKISRHGAAEFELFKISAVIPAEQRRIFRANKGEFFRQWFERASHKVNSVTVTTGVDQEINALLDATPAKEPVTVDYYVYHITSSNSPFYSVSGYIITDRPLGI